MSLGDLMFVLSGPLMLIMAALAVVWFAHWQDAREDRRGQKMAAGE